MSKVTVVIPFYQKDTGILRKAIASVLAQTGPNNIEIVVVDDESPVSPDGDIQIPLPSNCTMKVLRQKNSGPGAARNMGLDHTSPDTDFIAFLDSDDIWDSGHLRRAISALEPDMDFYFANHMEPDANIDSFSANRCVRVVEHQALPSVVECYRYSGDMMNQIVIKNIIETSTVVFRRQSLGNLRFRSEFRNAFEDHLFWLSVAEKTKKIVFSTHVDCHYGRGVNIYRSVGLGSERLMSQLIDQTRFRNELTRNYCKTPEQKLRISQLASETRFSFLAELLHRMRRRMTIDWKLVRRMLALDPVLAVQAIPMLFRILYRRKVATQH